MRRVAFLLLLVALSALGWPATIASAHWTDHAETNTETCEVVGWMNPHVDADHEHTLGGEQFVLHGMVRLFPLDQDEFRPQFLSYRVVGPSDTRAVFSLRNTDAYQDFSSDTKWIWRFYHVYLKPNRSAGGLEFLATGSRVNMSAKVPEHCTTPLIPPPPPPPKCQFVGGFESWVIQHAYAGACHSNEQSVGGGSLQSTDAGILFYDPGRQRVGIFDWSRVWQTLVSVPFAEPQPRQVLQAQRGAGDSSAAQCQFAGGFGVWTQQYANAGSCHSNEQHIAGGSLQSTENGILLFDAGGQRLGFFDWSRVWQALVSVPFTEPQPGLGARQPVTGDPAPSHCQFIGGFRDIAQQHYTTGNCNNNEQSVAGGAVQSAKNGLLFYHSGTQHLAFFEWPQVWPALAALPLVGPQIRQSAKPYSYSSDPDNLHCHYSAGYSNWSKPNSNIYTSDYEAGFSNWVDVHSNSGVCHGYEQFLKGGVVQSTENGIIFYNRDTLRYEFFDWGRVWQALAVAPRAAVPQPAPAPVTPVATTVPAVPAAPTAIQYVLGFAQWAQTSPGVGNCHNNELSVTGGSLQSTQNGILFYDRDNQRLAFFNWAQVRQAVAPLPFTQPQLPPTTETQTAAHCQFVLGFANWVQQHADAGACHTNEQFLASGSVQSTQNGILFYDSSNQRLGYFNWEHVWQGLALLDNNR